MTLEHPGRSPELCLDVLAEFSQLMGSAGRLKLIRETGEVKSTRSEADDFRCSGDPRFGGSIIDWHRRR